jgi:hypothetical protein
MAAVTGKEAAVGGTAGGALVLVWAARQFAGVELPAEVAIAAVAGLAWLASRLADRRGRHE